MGLQTRGPGAPRYFGIDNTVNCNDRITLYEEDYISKDTKFGVSSPLLFVIP